MPLLRSLDTDDGVPLIQGVTIRTVWLAVAVAGLAALVGDVGELS